MSRALLKALKNRDPSGLEEHDVVLYHAWADETPDDPHQVDDSQEDEQRPPFVPDGWTFEDVKAWMSQPRHPAGSSKGGQWSGGPSQKNYGPQRPTEAHRGPQRPTGSTGGGERAKGGDKWDEGRINKLAARKRGEDATVEEDTFAIIVQDEGAAKLNEKDFESDEYTIGEGLAIGFYTGDGYGRASDHLRKGKKDEFAEYASDKLKGIIDKSPPISEETTFYRVVDKDTMKSLGLKAGSSFVDKGFVSTTATEDGLRFQKENNKRAKDGWTMNISMPKGAKAFDVASYSWLPHEAEMILPPGSKFKVTSVDPKTKTANVEWTGVEE